MGSWHSYSSIYSLGHKAIPDLLKAPVLVEEKVDGSQFGFGSFDQETGQFDRCVPPNLYTEQVLMMRSRGAIIYPDAPEKMFTEAVATVKSIKHLLTPNWTYRGEYLKKPNHNALAYDRVPAGHIIIFDINTGEESYLPYDEKKAEAERLGLECVPALYRGIIENIEEFRKFLDTTSVLGGQKIEGVVVKPLDYDYFGRDHKCLMGKFVSESFREVQSKAWTTGNPTGKDILALLGDKYCTQARWQKAIQHLEERGELEGDPRDIGKLFTEIPADVKKECEEDIKEQLFTWAWPHIRRTITRGLPEWYKELLLKKQFEGSDDTEVPYV